MAQNVIAGLIEGNLQQGWACLQAEQWELAKQHFREAAEQVDQLAEIAREEAKPQPQQITLDV